MANKEHQFQKGDDPRRNMKGRPIGSVSPIKAVKDIFKEDPDRFREFVEEYIEDKQNRKHLVEMIDGKPQQKLEHSGQIKTIAIASEILDKNDITQSTEGDSQES